MPGEVLILIARPNRQVISLAEVRARGELNRVAGIYLSLIALLKVRHAANLVRIDAYRGREYARGTSP